jgi:hypothetical protein
MADAAEETQFRWRLVFSADTLFFDKLPSAFDSKGSHMSTSSPKTDFAANLQERLQHTKGAFTTYDFERTFELHRIPLNQ